jgi:hypothetical protein
VRSDREGVTPKKILLYLEKQKNGGCIVFKSPKSNFVLLFSQKLSFLTFCQFPKSYFMEKGGTLPVSKIGFYEGLSL